MMKTSRILLCAMILSLSAGALPGQSFDDATPLKLGEETLAKELVEPPNFWTSLVAMTFSLGAVLAMIGLAAWLAKKYLPVQKIGATGRTPIEVIGSRNIGNKQSLLLVRVRGSTFLLGRSSQSITTLGSLPTDEATDYEYLNSAISDKDAGKATSFARQLQSLTAK